MTTVPRLLAEIAFGNELDAFAGDPVFAALRALLAGLRRGVFDVVDDDPKVRDQVFARLVDALEPDAARLAHAAERLRDHTDGEAPDAADGFALGRAWARARLQVADAGAHELLRRALLRAFDPEVHDEGQVLRLLALLPALTHPDVDVLVRIAGGATPHVAAGSLAAEALHQLRAHRLLRRPEDDVVDVRATALGEALAALTEAPLAGPGPDWTPPWRRAPGLTGPDPDESSAAWAAERESADDEPGLH